MKGQQFKRRVLAGFILAVFAFSITPRIVLHGWFASHTDTSSKKPLRSHDQEIFKATYHCNCENIVAESPFTEPALCPGLFVLPDYLTLPQKQIPFISSGTCLFYSLRGPPAII